MDGPKFLRGREPTSHTRLREQLITCKLLAINQIRTLTFESPRRLFPYHRLV